MAEREQQQQHRQHQRHQEHQQQQHLSMLESLPSELIASIVERLCRDDLQQLRLSCRTLARLSRRFLARSNFQGLPWRNDIGRLDELSKMAECAPRIRALTLNFGQLDFYMSMATSFSHHYLLEHDMRSEKLREMWADYHRTQAMADAAGPFRFHLVEPALSRLPSLQAVTLTWTRSPWQDAEPKRLFRPDTSVAIGRSQAPMVQEAVLEALGNLDVKLKSLTVEPLMLATMSTLLRKDGPSSRVFGSLRRLALAVERSSEPVLHKELAYLLSRAPNLTHLHLKFLPWNLLHEEPSFLPNVYFPNLESLELIGAEAGLCSLASFLTRHAGTIKRLHLEHIKALQTTEATDARPAERGGPPAHVKVWDDVFRLIRERLKGLEAASIEGMFTEASGAALTFARHEVRISGETDASVIVMPAWPLERYLLEGGEYPELWWNIAGDW